MLAQYQHADLLLRYGSSLANDSNTIKRRPIHKFEEAVAFSAIATVADTSPPFGVAERLHAYNSMRTLTADLHSPEEALRFYQFAIETNDRVAEPLGNLAVLYLERNQLDRALKISKRAVDLQPHDARLAQNMGTIFYARDNEKQAQWWWERTLQITPNATEAMVSLATIYGSRGEFSLVQKLLMEAVKLAPSRPTRNSYRLQLTMSHLKMMYDSMNDLIHARHKFEAALTQLERENVKLPDVLGTIGSGSMGYYAIYQGYNDKTIRQQLAHIYFNGARDQLAFVADHVADDQPNEPKHHRLRVGYLSAFWYHHSVGLFVVWSDSSVASGQI